MKDEHLKDAAQGVAEGAAGDVPQDVAQDFAFGVRAARALLATPPPPPPPPPPTPPPSPPTSKVGPERKTLLQNKFFVGAAGPVEVEFDT